MSRKRAKTQVEVIEHNPVPVNEAEPEVVEPPDAWKALRAVVHKPNWRGRVSIYKPMYTPPGVVVAFYLAPGGFRGNSNFNEAKMDGWIPVPPELVTDNPDEAVSQQKIALLYYEVIDGLVRVGEHVLMVKFADDWYRKYYEDLRSLEGAVSRGTPGVSVDENYEETLSAVPKDYTRHGV